MPASNLRKRIQSLFADLERVASDPRLESAAVRREVEALQARLAALEAEVKAWQQNRPEKTPKSKRTKKKDVYLPAQPPSAEPLLYEKEYIAYAFMQNRLVTIKPDGLKDLEQEDTLFVPLTQADKPIGAVVAEPPPQAQWSAEETELTKAIARQASLQIQNLRLLAAAERARAEAQAATRRFAHESWASYLDAIHQRERLGYVYDQSAVELYTEPPPTDFDLQATVSVLDEQIGRVLLDADPSRPLGDEDKRLVSAVAQLLGQQVENLRLLADAARARAEAEQAIRSLTRQGWQTYAERRGDRSLGFVYDSLQVIPLADAPQQEVDLSHPLVIRGEPVGQLAVSGLAEASPEAIELMEAIAARASIHLETLRLNEELQLRAIQLQELDRLKSAFLANMSHELRTPLNSILGFADVMLEEIDGPLTENMKNDLQLIQRNGQHLLHLINDVLDMAKIESGRMNLHPELFRVHDVLEEVTSITSSLASEKNLSLFIEPESDREIEIVADVTRIRQVVINLVNNAIKFTDQGRITLRAARLASDRVLIAVKDTGIGIPPDKQELVFQEFSQVDTSTTRKAGGTGLGLPISRRLVEMHGGRLWVESSGIPGEGSTFYVELPIEAQIAESLGE